MRRAVPCSSISSAPSPSCWGVAATLVAGHWAAGLLPYLLPIAAGGFIYIAAADFIPSLHSHAGIRHDSLQVAVVMLGIGCMFGVGVFERLVTGST